MLLLHRSDLLARLQVRQKKEIEGNSASSVPNTHPQNSEHGIKVSRFLHVQPSSSAAKHHSAMSEAAFAYICIYSTVTADKKGFALAAGTSHGKVQRPQSQYKQDAYMPLNSHLFSPLGSNSVGL